MRGRQLEWLLGSALVLLSLPTASRAQDLQLSAFGGWRFGGSGRSPIRSQPTDIAGAPSFGGCLALTFWEVNAVELYFSRAEGDARPGAFGGERREIDVSYLQLGILRELDGAGIRPFLGASLGAARLREGLEAARTLFSAGAVAGLRVFPSRHLGLRTEARLLLIVDEQTRSRSRDSTGRASISIGGPMILQAELSVGLVVAF